MFYHVLIETKEKMGKYGKNEFFQFDILDEQDIINRILIPFENDITFQFDGYFLTKDKINRIL